MTLPKILCLLLQWRQLKYKYEAHQFLVSYIFQLVNSLVLLLNMMLFVISSYSITLHWLDKRIFKSFLQVINGKRMSKPLTEEHVLNVLFQSVTPLLFHKFLFCVKKITPWSETWHSGYQAVRIFETTV